MVTEHKREYYLTNPAAEYVIKTYHEETDAVKNIVKQPPTVAQRHYFFLKQIGSVIINNLLNSSLDSDQKTATFDLLTGLLDEIQRTIPTTADELTEPQVINLIDPLHALNDLILLDYSRKDKEKVFLACCVRLKPLVEFYAETPNKTHTISLISKIAIAVAITIGIAAIIAAPVIAPFLAGLGKYGAMIVKGCQAIAGTALHNGAIGYSCTGATLLLAAAAPVAAKKQSKQAEARNPVRSVQRQFKAKLGIAL